MNTLEELLRILKQGGHFFAIVPNEDCLENKRKKFASTFACNKYMYGIIKPFYPPCHINGFNKKSITTALQLSGITIKELNNFGSNYPFGRGFKVLSRPYLQAQLQVLSVNPMEM